MTEGALLILGWMASGLVGTFLTCLYWRHRKDLMAFELIWLTALGLLVGPCLLAAGAILYFGELVLSRVPDRVVWRRRHD